MRRNKLTRYAILTALAILVPALTFNLIPNAYAANPYSLAPAFPGYTQEGGTIALVFIVNPANVSVYQFRFFVQDPSSAIHQSILENVTNFSSSFYLILVYPSTTFPGPNNLVNQYTAWVDQIKPVPKSVVAATHFYIILTDNSQYVRTQTVYIHATGYNPLENVNVTVRPQSSSALVFSQRLSASSSGVVDTSWKIPRNATIDNYLVTITGAVTVKNPPDVTGFPLQQAIMSISSLSSSSSAYMRTQTMQFSFQPIYPDGTAANTGSATIVLTSPTGAKVNLVATYDSVSQTFKASYKTTINNQTGTWNATMAPNSFDDSYGNKGPSGPSLTTLPQLNAAVLTIAVSATSYVPVGGQLSLNANITYPDGSALQSGPGIGVGAYMIHGAAPQVNDTVVITFDSTLQHWVGSYSLQSSDPGGLWTLYVKASDASNPPNTGLASKAVTTQDHPPIASFNPSTSSAPTGIPINLDGTASYDPDGTVATWAWTFGDGNSGVGSTTSHTYNTAGTYTITLTVTDNSGSTGVTTAQVTITDRPPVASFTRSNSTAPTGTSINFDGTASSDPDGTLITWSWTFGDGSTGTGSTTSHAYSTAGSYTITLTVIDNSGSIGTATSQVTITDRAPVVSFTASTANPSSGQLVTLSITASDPDGSVSTITVNWGDGTVHTLPPTATTDSHTYSSSGSYKITVTATDNSAQSTSSSPASVSVAPASSNGNISLPLYYFGILAALIAALLAGAFLAFRRHKVTHAKLKIDLEAVRSEAGRIENQEFFQSVKDQLKKDKDD